MSKALISRLTRTFASPRHLLARTACGMLACLALLAGLPVAAESSGSLLAQGDSLRRNGDVNTAINVLTQARRTASTPEASRAASIALGIAYLQARRLEDAEAALDAAYRDASGTPRANAALELGNLALTRKQNARAEALYRETLTLSGNDNALGIAARINLARLIPAAERLAQLDAIAPAIARLADTAEQADFHLNLGLLALQSGSPGLTLAYRQLDQARQLSQANPAARAHIAALDALGGIYETQKRWSDVITLGQLTLDAAVAGPLGPIQDLLLATEWRLGRAYRQTGRADLALAAYSLAVEHAQAIRPDLPIETADGRSIYQSLLQPLFEGYIELQMDGLAAQPAQRQHLALARVRDIVEALRQAEMQDFLGDRCTVEEGDATRLEAGVAAVYPILLADRIELIIEDRDGLRRFTSKVSRAEVTRAARTLAEQLRSGSGDYLTEAMQLYDWLIRPFESQLADRNTLVVVPDGVLRLIPFAALHDGKGYLIERIAIATVTGLTMTNNTAPPTGIIAALLAGVAEPGPVVDKLASTDIMRAATGGSRALASNPLTKTRAFRSVSGSSTRALNDRDTRALRESLALPGVREEVQALARTLNGHVLLDATFNIANFQNEAEGGDYRIVHIASHGVFGGTAETSFILAYDDLLGINRLQSVLRSEKVQQNPIELLALSACETAEGNDRAPLGIAGAAIRARAKSVLGTLWPVEDQAANRIMSNFYQGISAGKLSKAAALRQAQLMLIKNPDTEHPIFWAPFNLVGNWK